LFDHLASHHFLLGAEDAATGNLIGSGNDSAGRTTQTIGRGFGAAVGVDAEPFITKVVYTSAEVADAETVPSLCRRNAATS